MVCVYLKCRFFYLVKWQLLDAYVVTYEETLDSLCIDHHLACMHVHFCCILDAGGIQYFEGLKLSSFANDTACGIKIMVQLLPGVYLQVIFS